VAIAYGKAVKVTGITPTPESPESADADGMAILNYHPGQDLTEVQVALTGFMPYTDYKVLVSGAGVVNIIITTNAAGNGSGHNTGVGDMTRDDNGDPFCIVVEVTKDGETDLRADGSVNCS